MKKIGLFLIIVLSAGLVFGQDTKEDRKAAKKARKEEQKRINLENTERLKLIVGTKQFVLEAHTLFDRTGMSYNLNPTLNFVGFDGTNSSIQLSFNQLVGWNGVGGVTIDGRIDKMEIKGNDKKPNFSVDAAVKNRTGGYVTMIFRVSSDGNARVDMSGSFGEKVSFQGRIVALSQTSVYKGTPIN
jgi:hypothetical protein